MSAFFTIMELDMSVISPVQYHAVWPECPPDWQDRVREFWRSQGLLTDEAEIGRRLRQICCLASLSDRLVGVSTARLALIPQLRASFFFFRCAVLPEFRQQGVARALAVRCRDTLSDWSRRNPEAHACGMATVVESPLLSEFAKLPQWPASGLSLIGYTEQGQQLRIVWFEHARLEPKTDCPTDRS